MSTAPPATAQNAHHGDLVLRVLRSCIVPPAARPLAGLPFMDWWHAASKCNGDQAEPFVRAVLGGLAADRLGYAFAAGYQAALRRLFPQLRGDAIGCLSISEADGAHPRAIHTALQCDAGGGYVLSGRKRWATLAPLAEHIFVAASEGVGDDQRNRIRMVQISPPCSGLTITPMPPTAFTPEIEHAELELAELRIDAQQILPGDGYTDYIKPFRTLEDVHVSGATLGFLIRTAHVYGWPRPVREQMLGLVVCLAPIAAAAPESMEYQLALAGFFQLQSNLFAQIEACWPMVDREARERWVRDQGLLQVAGRVRLQRGQAAWERLQERE